MTNTETTHSMMDAVADLIDAHALGDKRDGDKVRRWKAYIPNVPVVGGTTPKGAEESLDDLERQLAKVQFEQRAYQDALRYRFLRQMIFDDRIIVRYDQMLSGEKLDAAVDSCIAERELQR